MRIKDIFTSFQGEGSMVGTRATFVRAVGCNKTCSFCDTDFSGSGDELDINWTPEDQSVEWIWLTGGEPLLQDVVPYVRKWRSKGYNVALETNGTVELPCGFDHVALSPKCHAGELKQWRCHDLKVVVPSFDPSEYCGVKAKHYFVQPEWGTEIPKNIPRGWKLSIQNHKYWGIK